MTYLSICDDFKVACQMLWDDGHVDAGAVRVNTAAIAVLSDEYRRLAGPAWFDRLVPRPIVTGLINPITGTEVPVVEDTTLPDGALWVLPGRKYVIE